MAILTHMFKKQNGFGLVGVVAIVALLAVIATVGYYSLSKLGLMSSSFQKEPLSLEIKADKNTVQTDDMVELTVTFYNRTSEDIVVNFGSSCTDPTVHVGDYTHGSGDLCMQVLTSVNVQAGSNKEWVYRISGNQITGGQAVVKAAWDEFESNEITIKRTGENDTTTCLQNGQEDSNCTVLLVLVDEEKINTLAEARELFAKYDLAPITETPGPYYDERLGMYSINVAYGKEEEAKALLEADEYIDELPLASPH